MQQFVFSLSNFVYFHNLKLLFWYINIFLKIILNSIENYVSVNKVVREYKFNVLCNNNVKVELKIRKTLHKLKNILYELQNTEPLNTRDYCNNKIFMDNNNFLQSYNENRNEFFAINQGIINGTNSVTAFNNESQNFAVGMQNMRSSSSLWQYPVTVHESLVAMPFSPLGLQIMRENNNGHLIFLPPTTAAVDSLHPTIMWSSVQQPTQTPQMPHLVFPTIQAFPNHYAPLHFNGTDFLSSTTLRQHTQTQTRLIAMSNPENKMKSLGIPKFQPDATLKLDDKNHVNIEYKTPTFKNSTDGLQKFDKQIEYSQEPDRTVLFKNQSKNPLNNSYLCENMEANLSLTNVNNTNIKNEIITTDNNSSSGEYMTQLNSELFCYSDPEMKECNHCTFSPERHDVNTQTENMEIKDSVMYEQDSCDKDPEDLSSHFKENSLDMVIEKQHESIEDNNVECTERRILDFDSSANISTVAAKSPIEVKMLTKMIHSENNDTDKSENFFQPIDLSGLELLSNISVEATQQNKIIHLKAENANDGTQLQNDSNQTEKNGNSPEESVPKYSKEIETRETTLGGLNLLCALAEQRIQEEGKNTTEQSISSTFYSQHKRKKSVKCKKNHKMKNIKYLKYDDEENLYEFNNIKNRMCNTKKSHSTKYTCCDKSKKKKKSFEQKCFRCDIDWLTGFDILKAMEVETTRKLIALRKKYANKVQIEKKEIISNNNEKITVNNESINTNESNTQLLKDQAISTITKPKNNCPINNEMKNSLKNTFENIQFQLFKNISQQKSASNGSISLPPATCIDDNRNYFPTVESANIFPNNNNLVEKKFLPKTYENSISVSSNNHLNPVENIPENKSIILRLQKRHNSTALETFNDYNKKKKFKHFQKLLKIRHKSKKLKRSKLMKATKNFKIDEKMKIIDDHLRLSEKHLNEPKIRVLTAMGGLFYAGYLQPIEPPDLYAVTLDGERGNKPHIMCREEVLRDVILEISPASANEVPRGTRICAYWSSQYRCLYPGITVETSFENEGRIYVNVEFDDGDSGKISLEDIRFLLSDYPIVEYNMNPLTSLEKKKIRRAENGSSNLGNIIEFKTEPDEESQQSAVLETGKDLSTKTICTNDSWKEICMNSQEENFPQKKLKKKKKHKKRHHKHSEHEKIIIKSELYTNENVFNEDNQTSMGSLGLQNISEYSAIQNVQNDLKLDYCPDKKPDKTHSKIAAFLPEKQLWQWLGDFFRRVGAKSRTKKKFYRSIQRGEETLTIGDCAVFLSTDADRPYVGKIQKMWETSSNNKVVKVRWFYHPEETVGCSKLKYPGGLFESSHEDENDVQTISHKCEVLPLKEYIEKFGVNFEVYSENYNNDIYYYAGFYEPVSHKIQMQADIPIEGNDKE